MSGTIHTEGNVPSPSSKRDLLEFLEHLAAIDRDGNKRISADELMTHILAKAQRNPEATSQLNEIREDIAAIRDLPALRNRWQQRDPTVTAQMIGTATDADSVARERLGTLLGYEPQFIENVLRENKSAAAAEAARVDPEIMAVRQQLSAYKHENVEMPNLGTLDRALANMTSQAPKSNGPNVP